MDPIEIDGRYGGPMLRDGLIVTFFKQAPFPQWAPEVTAAFDYWLSAAPADAITHALVGARATRVAAVQANTVARCRSQLDAGKAAQREISSIELGGPQKVNPSWLCDVWGGLDATPGSTRTNYVQMRLPRHWLDATGDNLETFTLNCAQLLTFDSAYASLALHWSTDAELTRAASKIPGIALRHPGLDLHHHKDLRFTLGRRVVGARWLTLLGPDLAHELGGEAELRARISDDVNVQAIPRGVALRAKGPPRAGDVNLGDPLPELQSMAVALESVTHFEETSKLLVNPETLERWQRRFL